MDLTSFKGLSIGIVGPVDLALIDKEMPWPYMPAGNEYPMFSYYANYLMENEIKVVIYTTAPGISHITTYHDRKISILVVPQNANKNYRNLLAEAKSIKHLILLEPSDVLLAQWTYEYAWGALLTGIKTIVTINDNTNKIFAIKPTFNKFFKVILNQFVVRKAIRLIAVSEYVFAQIMPRIQAKTQVIPNFYPQYLEQEFVDYDSRKKTFITFCNGYGKRTNIEKAIEAFTLFCERNKEKEYNYHLVGIGTGLNQQAYQHAVKIKAPMTKLIFHGYLSHPVAMGILKYGTLLIHPSLEEANSISIIESMALGVPVIGHIFCEGVKEQLSNSLGFLCNANDPFDICKTMEFCIENPNICANLSTRTRKHAIRKYNAQKVISEQLAMIKTS